MCEKLNLKKLKTMFTDYEHTADGKSRYDFTSKDGKRYLSAKTSKHKESKISPQCIGQVQPIKFCRFFNIEYKDNKSLQKYIEENIVKVLKKFIEYTFDCPIIYYNRELKSVKVIKLKTSINWNKYGLSWTRSLENGSATLKVNGVHSILEIQFHTKSRTNITSRWLLEKMLKVFSNNFDIQSI